MSVIQTDKKVKIQTVDNAKFHATITGHSDLGLEVMCDIVAKQPGYTGRMFFPWTAIVGVAEIESEYSS